MESIKARVVGFKHGSPVTYTTEVVVRGDVRYKLAVRYSTFHAAYTKLVAADKSFVFQFPKKGGLFSSPSPADRQSKLDAFLVAALAHLAKRNFAPKLGVVLEGLLQIQAHVPLVEKKVEVPEPAGSETSESSVDEPAAEPIAQLVAAKVEAEKAAAAVAGDVKEVVAVVEEVKVEVKGAKEEVKEGQGRGQGGRGGGSHGSCGGEGGGQGGDQRRGQGGSQGRSQGRS